MSHQVYVAVLGGSIILVTLLLVPAILTKKCPECGTRNGLDESACRNCGQPFPDAEP